MRAKSERVERELKGKFPPFFAYFLFSMGLFIYFFFPLYLRRRRCHEKALETEVQKRECKSGSQK